jgi:hypothetical protein
VDGHAGWGIDIVQLRLGVRVGVGRGERLVGPRIDLRFHLGAEGIGLFLGQRLLSDEQLLEAGDGVLLGPLGEELLRNIRGARGFLMAAHTEGLELEERRTETLARPGRCVRHRVMHGQQVVAVHDLAGNAVADGLVGDVLARVLLGGRRREAVLVVLDDEENGELPHRGQVHRFVEVAFTGRSVARKRRGDAVFLAKLGGESQSVGHGQHRPQVADHADDPVIGCSEVKRSIAPLGEAAVLAEELPEQLGGLEAARREDAEVPVHRQDVVVVAQCRRHADGDRFLADPRKPLRQPSLPQEVQHLLFDHPREEDLPVQVEETLFRGHLLRHGADWSSPGRVLSSL